MPMLRFLLVVGLVSITPAAWAQENAQVARGKTLLEANCARCHAIGLTDKSTHPSAPAFRTLSRLYPVESLEEALAEGISTGHPDMPVFVASPEQIGAIVAYIGSVGGQ